MRTLLLTLFFTVLSCIAQVAEFKVSGYVLDEDNNPVPYANVYIKQLSTGNITDELGRYYFELEEGYYDFVFSYLGYKDKEVKIVVDGKHQQKDVYLESAIEELGEVVITKRKRDISYEMIRNVIANKHKYKFGAEKYSCAVYTKGVEEFQVKTKMWDTTSKKYERHIRDSLYMDSMRLADTTGRYKNYDAIPKMSMLEKRVTLNFQYPDKYKEIKHAETKRGYSSRIYAPKPGPSDFNIYHNIVTTKLLDIPAVSPIANSAFVSYKFKHLKSYKEDGQLYHKIRIIPRSHGNSLFSGTVVVSEKYWFIKEFDLTLPNNTLKGYDQFKVHQMYQRFDDSTLLLEKEIYNYQEKMGKRTYLGKTHISYANYDLDKNYKKRYFSNEVQFVETEAYERDSAYWNLQRPVPLTQEERDYVLYSDSVAAAHKKESYLDSMDREFNKVTLMNLLWSGQGFVNREKKQVTYFTPLLGTASPFNPGGYRAQYWMSFFKEWDDKRFFMISPELSYGFRNTDVRGRVWVNYYSNPFKFSRWVFTLNRGYGRINEFGNIIGEIQRSNYTDYYEAGLGRNVEIVNGLFFFWRGYFRRHESLSSYLFGNTVDNIFNRIGGFEDNSPLEFDAFNNVVTDFWFEFTPGQKYIREPKRKVVLGSKWPTFSLDYRKGWNGLLGSNSNYDYIEFGIKDKVSFKTLGNSNYNIRAGKFINQKNVPLTAYKYQVAALPYMFIDPLTSFQVLDQTFPTFDWFIEAHYLHYFNGVVMNKFPLIRKTKIKTNAGYSALYAFENNYFHQEIYVGAEKNFKLLNDRYRIGVYYAIGQSNQTDKLFTPTLKFSIKQFDRKSQRFEF